MKQVVLRLDDDVATALDRKVRQAGMKREPYIKALIEQDIALAQPTANEGKAHHERT